MAHGVGFNQVANMIAQVQGADANIAAEVTANVAQRVALHQPTQQLPSDQALAELNVKYQQFAEPANCRFSWIFYPFAAEKCADLLRIEHGNRVVLQRHINYLQQRELAVSLVASQMVAVTRNQLEAMRAERDAHERTINGPNGNDGLRQNLAAAEITLGELRIAAIAANGRLVAITQERDTATASLATRTQERDDALQRLQQEREGNQKLLQIVESADACIQKLKIEMQTEQERLEKSHYALKQQLESVIKSKEELTHQIEASKQQRQELEQQNDTLKDQNTAAQLQLARLQERSSLMQGEKEQQQRLFITVLAIGLIAYMVLQISNSLRYR